MSGITDIKTLLGSMSPRLNDGTYVFCAVESVGSINPEDIIGIFREAEAITLILNKEVADSLNLEYTYLASWITLTIHSSLEAVGLTAAISTALAENNISCNVVAAYYHDHIFVDQKNADRAVDILIDLARGHSN